MKIIQGGCSSHENYIIHRGDITIMRTVLYIDYSRNKSRYLRGILSPVIFLAICFIISIILELIFPKLNTYLNFPDIIKDFFALYYWQSHLFSNLWNMFAVIFPFTYYYELMTGLSKSVIMEERLETVIYMRNLGISRSTMLLTKFGIWSIYSLLNCVIIFVENMLFFVIIRNNNMIKTAGIYSIRLFVIGIIYLSIALFIASFTGHEKDSENISISVIIIPFLIARIHAFIRLFADLLTLSGKSYKGLDKLYNVADSLTPLHLICPMFWTYPGQRINLSYVICASAITIIMLFTGYSIYTRDTIIYRNR